MPRVESLLAAHAPWAAADRDWPLTPFELFMWLDDRPSFPLLFRIDIRFQGPLDAAAMQDAFRFALGRHPLLRATIARDRHGVRWRAPARRWNSLTLSPRGPATEPDAEWLDLTAEPGLRGSIRETEAGSDVTLVFHHACCDGQGARMFIQDLALGYAVLRGVAKAATLPALDAIHLDRRGMHALRPSTWRGLGHLVQMFRTRPRPAAHDHDGVGVPAATSAPIGFCAHTFDRPDVRLLQDPRRLGSARFNDVAVALLFMVIERWQRDRGVLPGARMRISVPVDLRGREHERMPAANRYAYLFVNRHVGACRDWPALLAATHGQLRSRRHAVAGGDMLSALDLMARWPRVMRWVLRRRRCFATAVLTNLSDPSRRLRRRLPVDDEGCIWLDRARCHDMQLRMPPLRPQTHWGVGIFEYAGRVTFTFRHDPATLSATAARGVLDAYVDAWRDWLETTPAADRAG